MIRRGEAWGDPAAGPPDIEAAGDDVDLAAAVRAGLRNAKAADDPVLIRFDASPRSDLARAVGLMGAGTARTEVALDVMALHVEPRSAADLAVNAVVVGVAPDRLRWWHRRVRRLVTVDGRTVFDGAATSVVIANGQFLRGHDIVPAGHPGDGRIEVQVYGLGPGERGPMRRRLRGAAHLPHPRIATAAGHDVVVEGAGVALEVDGVVRGRARHLRAEVAVGAYRLLV